ncbi:MAG: transglutaminase domain-containing protein [Planctomycetes bacterium]|nr:transglutaminase domain-containing protein [Planctomycetota bacterium]MCP4771881.1 transglutaminase domain-containing protein [Planctomycetota bacterium]MCP4861883.1 transglutaminase domain-containing protein [Planctomycetota bacterium]
MFAAKDLCRRTAGFALLTSSALLLSCASPTAAQGSGSIKELSYLESALREAADNRGELERALAHYENGDPQKYAAMQFLIENMPGHGFVELRFFNEAGSEIAFEALDYSSLGEAEAAFDALQAEHGSMDYAKKKFVADLDVMTADYLINNVEMAFDAWRGKPWASQMNFDTFCQHILPYRGSNEPLDDWRAQVMNHFADLDQQLDDPNSAAAAAGKIEAQAHAWVGFWDLYYLHPTDQSYGEMMASGKGRCEDITNMISYGLRANAVAVGSDYTPAWANRDNNHAWTTVLGPDGRGATKQGNIAAKIYRKTFALQRDAWMHQAASGELVPRWLARDHFIDVTEQYLDTIDTHVHFTQTPPAGHKLAYLAVFNGGNWVAITAAPIEGEHANFTDLGPGIVYLPVFYDGKELLPAASPFTLDKDGKKVLCGIPETPSPKVESVVITTTKPVAHDPDKGQPIAAIQVKAGETYELFYWDHGWQSLGKHTASDDSVSFDGLPGHRLYWLVRDGSRKLERIFTLEPKLRYW